MKKGFALGELLIFIVFVGAIAFCGILYLNALDEIDITPITDDTQIQHSGQCLEYITKYKLDCGLFVSDSGFCKERKYEECVRWEDEINNLKKEK